MSRSRFLIVIATVLVGGCSDDHDSVSRAQLSEASLPGVYAGIYPCEGCSGIASTLWLRSDGRFFFRQRYPANEVREAMDAYGLGRWSAMADARMIELRGDGPTRTFERLDRDTLDMQADSDLLHRLIRDATTTNFTDTIRMAGTIRVRGNNASFTECLTGLAAPVSKGGDFAGFKHQYRSASGRKESAYVELEGRFSWTGDGMLRSLTIERFITVKAAGAC